MPYRTPKHVQQQKDTKRKHILDAALQLFAEKGYDNTSIQEICSAAGVSVGSIYFYFPNKEKIYGEVYLRLKEDYLKALKKAIEGETDINKTIYKAIEVAVTSSLPNVNNSNFFVTNTPLKSIKEKRDDLLQTFALHVKNYLDNAVQNAQLKPINTELAAVNFAYSTYQVIKYWNLNGRDFSPEEIIDFLYNYHIRGLKLNNSEDDLLNSSIH